MKKPYLLSIASYVPGVEDYISSLPNLGSSVEWINIELKNYPGNLARFDHIPLELEDDRMLIFTDTSDVVFQCPIAELENKIYVAPENDTFNKHSWFGQYLARWNFTELEGLPIYNMGTWAMPVKKAREMRQFLVDNAHRFDHHGQCDQPLYNLWLKDQVFEEHPTLMSCLYNNYNTGRVKKTKDGFVNQNGEPYSIVHGNGNTKWILNEPIELLNRETL